MRSQQVALAEELIRKLWTNEVEWAMSLKDFRKVAAAWEARGLPEFTGQREVLARPMTENSRWVKAIDGCIVWDPRGDIWEELAFRGPRE